MRNPKIKLADDKKLKTGEIHFAYICIVNNLFNVRIRSREK